MKIYPEFIPVLEAWFRCEAARHQITDDHEQWAKLQADHLLDRLKRWRGGKGNNLILQAVTSMGVTLGELHLPLMPYDWETDVRVLTPCYPEDGKANWCTLCKCVRGERVK